jgi:hypothetical protein
VHSPFFFCQVVDYRDDLQKLYLEFPIEPHRYGVMTWVPHGSLGHAITEWFEEAEVESERIGELYVIITPEAKIGEVV